MAEPLKNQYGPEIPSKIAGMISEVFPKFDSTAFIGDTLDGYEALGLTQRGWHITKTLCQYLPRGYEVIRRSKAPRFQPQSPGPRPQGHPTDSADPSRPGTR